jgi:hypothetical protein
MAIHAIPDARQEWATLVQREAQEGTIPLPAVD